MRRRNRIAVTRSLLERIGLSLSGLLATLVWVTTFPAHTVLDGVFPTEVHPPHSAFTTVVTAYSSSEDETQGDPFITASGEYVRDGIVACAEKYAFGTRFLIEDRVYECQDRLAPEYRHRIDIWMPSKDEALGYGKRLLRVQLLHDGA